MGAERGRNSGLTGVIDLPGVLASGVKFEVRIYRWAPKIGGTPRARRGRGGGRFTTVRWVFSSGSVACSGKLRADGWPAPAQWEGQPGTITITVHTGKTIAYPIVVSAMDISFDEHTQDMPDITLAASVTDVPTYTGWGAAGSTQPVPGVIIKSDQEQYEGTSKTLDPLDIATSSVRVTDFWGDLVDTDGAEATKLAAVIAAAQPPLTGLKLRTAVLARDAVDGGTITETWGRTSTAEDEAIPHTSYVVDPNGLRNGGTVAAVDTTPGLPPGTVSRGLRIEPINDGHQRNIIEGGTQDSIQEITQPESFKIIDPSGVDVAQDVTRVYATGGSLPSNPSLGTNQVIYAKRTQEITFDHSKVTFQLKGVTAEQELEFPHLKASVDNATHPINGEYFAAKMGAVTSFGVYVTPPTAPTPASGYKIAEYFDVPVMTNSGFNVRVWRLATKDSNDEAIFAHRRTETDPQGINTRSVDALVFLTASPPADVTPPSGQVIVLKADITLDTATSVRIYTMGLNDSKDEIERPGTSTQIQSEPSRLFRPHTRKQQDRTVISCLVGDTADALAQTAYDALARGSGADVTVFDVAVRKINKLLAEKTVTRGVNFIMMEGSTGGGWVEALSHYSGSAVQVWVDQVLTRGSQKYAKVARQRVWEARFRFKLSRRVLTDASGNLDLKIAYHGKANAASFLGFGTNQVGFLYRDVEGFPLEQSGDGKGKLIVPVADHFEFRTGGAIDEVGIVEGWRMTSGAVSAGAWNDASLFGWGASLLATDNFTTGFLS